MSGLCVKVGKAARNCAISQHGELLHNSGNRRGSTALTPGPKEEGLNASQALSLRAQGQARALKKAA